jgi:hypothetical protein
MMAENVSDLHDIPNNRLGRESVTFRALEKCAQLAYVRRHA